MKLNENRIYKMNKRENDELKAIFTSFFLFISPTKVQFSTSLKSCGMWCGTIPRQRKQFPIQLLILIILIEFQR